MYDSELAEALRALVPPLYYVVDGPGGDGLRFTRDSPPKGALPVGTADAVSASLASSDHLPCTRIWIHVFRDRASALAFDRGVSFGYDALQSSTYHDPVTDLSFVAFYDVESNDIDVTVHDQRDLTTFHLEHLFERLTVTEGGDSYVARLGDVVLANENEREVLCALRSLLDRVVLSVTVHFGAGGSVTYAIAAESPP